jgi:glutaredoxin
MPTRIVLAISILLLTFSIAGAEMYQWVDENGVVTFKDTPPPPAQKQKKVKVYRDSDFAPPPAPDPAPATTRSDQSSPVSTKQPTSAKNERFTGTVELYVTSWCGYCKQALAYVRNNNIKYVAYDIEKDAAAKQRYQELGGHGVPLIVIGKNTMSGYSQENLEYYLNNPGK